MNNCYDYTMFYLQAEYKSKSRKDYKLVALQMLDQGVKVLNKEANVSRYFITSPEFSTFFHFPSIFCNLCHISPLSNHLYKTFQSHFIQSLTSYLRGFTN